MSVGTLISLDEYLRTSFDPDCDFVDGEVVERHVGQERKSRRTRRQRSEEPPVQPRFGGPNLRVFHSKKHGYAQCEIGSWFSQRKSELRLQPLTELRMQVNPSRVRVPDVVVSEMPLPLEEVFTSAPYLCVEIMSPRDTMFDIQERTDEYLLFGVPNVWVIDPWKHRGWHVTQEGWRIASDGIMRTADNRVAMPLADVLLP
jgi:hypothetical protein